MKKIVLACLSIVMIFSSCSKTKQKMVVSKFSNDTLYSYNVPDGQSLSSLDVPFELTPNPSVKDIMKKALVNEDVAKKWLKERKSESVTVVSKSKEHVSFVWYVLGTIALIFFLMMPAPTRNA